MSKHAAIFPALLIILIAAALAMVMGTGHKASASSIQDRVVGERVLPRVQIFNFDDSVARLDTVTGELHIFTGDVRRPGTRGQWRLLASGVANTSGYLDVQTPRGVEAYPVLFLVDIVTGDTWVFNRRAARGTWDPVDVFRR